MIVLYLRGLLGRCPNCGKGRMAKGLFDTHESCSNCGMRFRNAPGDFTGASVIAYAIVSLSVLVVGMLAVLADVSLPLVMVGGAVLTVVIAVLTHQPIKGLWIAFLVHTEALVPPKDDDRAAGVDGILNHDSESHR